VQQVHEAPAPSLITPSFHHIGVQTTDLDNCLSWYQDFFGARPVWTLTRFSELTLKRLPGIARLSEMVLGNMRLHLFERAAEGTGQHNPWPYHSDTQFQHLCLQVASSEELARWRQRWRPLYDSGRYVFALPEQPTEIIRDSDRVESFYCLDVNGLEYEFTYIPDGQAR
jgi:catechol 2,3-dioxygenase-like lactoylglutathione lyase family enzyme